MSILDFKPQNFTPWRKATQIATARYILFPLYFWRHRLSVSGRENVPEGNLLIVANHLSNWDPPVIVIATDKPMGFLAKDELFAKPGFARLIEFYNAISINRQKPEKSTFKSVKQIFKAGWSVGMFIEGTRSRIPGELGPPHNGAAYFARANNVPILPVGLVGTDKKGQKAYARIGKIIQPKEDLDATTWEVMEALSQLTGFKLPARREQLADKDQARGKQGASDED